VGKILDRNRIVYDIRDNMGTFIEHYIEADDGSRSSGRILWCEAMTTRKCF
jgi:hypothetical protein